MARARLALAREAAVSEVVDLRRLRVLHADDAARTQASAGGLSADSCRCPALAAAKELAHARAKVVGVLELEVGHVAQVAEVLEQRRLDWCVFPHQEEHRRACAAKHVIRELESAALAHADPCAGESARSRPVLRARWPRT